MENKRYEELIDLIINENEEKARELFHEIVVEKSREIYESIMDEEMSADLEEGDQVQSMMDEIEVDETMSEDESDAEELDHDAEEAGHDLTKDMEADGEDDMDIEDKVDDLEDRIVDAENEIDALIKKFEEELGGAGAGEEVEVGAEEEMMEASDDEEEAVEEAEEMDEEVMEAVQLQKVSVTHGDNGSNTKSPALTKPKVEAAGVKPVKFSGDHEAVPTGPKGPSNEYSKKEGKLIGDVANTPGMKKAPALKAAPKPDTKDGSDKGAKSPVAKA